MLITIDEQQARKLARRAISKAHEQRLKMDALIAYGRVCACCEEHHPVFLTIDHINGKTASERVVHRTGAHFYRWLRKNHYPKGFRVLCWNCNSGRAVNGGVCPHKERKCSSP